MKRFVIIAHGRSGSNLLVHAIRQHPDVQMFGEPYLASEADRRSYFSIDGRYLREGEDGASFARDVVYAPRDKRAVGFKILHDQAPVWPTSTVWRFLEESKDISVILLDRENKFATLASWEAALRTNEWVVQTAWGVAPKVAPPFAISVERCEWFFEAADELRDRMTAPFAGHRTLALEYRRDLCEDFASSMRRVTDFLGVCPFSPEKTLRKQGDRPLGDQISNFGELRRHFAGTRYRHYFD